MVMNVLPIINNEARADGMNIPKYRGDAEENVQNFMLKVHNYFFK